MMTIHKEVVYPLTGDSVAARQLARGFALVPCWITNEQGVRIRACKWVKQQDPAQ